MSGKARRAEATEERRLRPEVMDCADCGQRLRSQYTTWRKVATLEGMRRLNVSIWRGENPACAHSHRPTHPMEEGHVVLPHYGKRSETPS